MTSHLTLAEALRAGIRTLATAGVPDAARDARRLLAHALRIPPDRLAAITWVHETNGDIIDPHTADGVTVARALAEPGENVLVLETAKPQKFADTVVEALGVEAPVSDELADLLGRPQRTVDMADDAQVLRDYIVQHAVR